jgi:tetratricopeptide (TPR) repeat protein
VDLAREAVPAGASAAERAWQGTLLAAAGRPTEAEGLLRKAAANPIGTADAGLALVRFLADQGQLDQAEEVLEELRDRLEPDSAPLVLAQGYEALGRFDRAARQYQAAARRRPDDRATLGRVAAFLVRVGRTADAEPVLRNLLSLKTLTTDESAGARRLLALVLAEHVGESALREADALLDRNRTGQADAPADRPVRLLVAAARPATRARALSELERRRGPTLPPAVALVLARIYDRGDDWERGRQLVEGLLTQDGANPAYLAFLADGLLRHDQEAEARGHLRRLEKVEPESARTRALLERIGPSRRK